MKEIKELNRLVREFNDLLYEVSREYKSVIYIDSILKECEEVLQHFDAFKNGTLPEVSIPLLNDKECLYLYQTILEEAKDFIRRFENERLLVQEVITVSIFADTLANEMIRYLSDNSGIAAEILGELLHNEASE